MTLVKIYFCFMQNYWSRLIKLSEFPDFYLGGTSLLVSENKLTPEKQLVIQVVNQNITPNRNARRAKDLQKLLVAGVSAGNTNLLCRELRLGYDRGKDQIFVPSIIIPRRQFGCIT